MMITVYRLFDPYQGLSIGTGVRPKKRLEGPRANRTIQLRVSRKTPGRTYTLERATLLSWFKTRFKTKHTAEK